MHVLVNFFTDYIKTSNIDNMGMKSVYLCFNGFPLFFNVCINRHRYTNYANKIICIFDHEMKALWISFKLVPILLVHDKLQLR